MGSPDPFARLRQRTEQAMRHRVRADGASPGGAAWFALARAIVSATTSADPSAAAAAGLDLLGALIGVEQEQNALLESIDRQVGLLRAGPFLAGRVRLQEAERCRDDAERRHMFLDEARSRFYDAHGLAASAHERAVVELHLGVVWQLLGRTDDSRHWFATAHATLAALVSELTQAAGDVKVLKTRTGVALASYFYPAGLVTMAAKLVKVRRSERALQTLSQVLPVLGVAARGSADPALGSYQLVQSLTGWALQPVTFTADDTPQLSSD